MSIFDLRPLAWVALLAAGLVMLAGCPKTGTSGGAAQPPDIRAVHDQVKELEGAEVTLTGRFRGWKGACPGGPPATRSDWMLEDASGCIYVTGKIPTGVNPAVPQGEELTVTGTVIKGKQGQAYLKIR